VLPLVPVFLTFVVLHAVIIAWAIVANAGNLSTIATATVNETRRTTSEVGVVAMLVIVLRAFSLGGGTARSRGSKRSATACRSSASRASRPRSDDAATWRRRSRSPHPGLLVAYLLAGVQKEAGRTLNATLFYSLTSQWQLGGVDFGHAIVVVALVSEAALLFVAAQAGFLDGPRVLANMAIDFWVPTRFAPPVRPPGDAGRGLDDGFRRARDPRRPAAATCACSSLLYAVNVFVTFSLSQLGMVIHWWNVRREERAWARRLAASTASVSASPASSSSPC